MTMTTTEASPNPAVPTTMGALIAEEITINPLSPLPSFLEMKMMEEMTNSAQRSLKSAVDTVAEQASRQRIRITASRTSSSSWYQRFRVHIIKLMEYLTKKYSPEIRMLLLYLIQRRCLQSNSCATVSESLYGAKRARLGEPDKTTGERKILTMKDQDKIRLALILTLGPYLQERLDTLFDRLSASRQRQPFSQTIAGKLKRIFVTIYPLLQMTQEGTIVAYQWMYLLGRTWFFHPSSHILNQVVRRVTVADNASSPSSSATSRTNTAATTEFSKYTRQIRRMLFLGASSALVVGWIAQWRNQIREHRRQHHHQQGSSRGVIPPPPLQPPIQLDPKQRLRSLPSNPTHCPLCRQPRVNPAASTSGFVFCHRCLVLYVRDHGKCPLTGMKCPESKIVRLFEPIVS